MKLLPVGSSDPITALEESSYDYHVAASTSNHHQQQQQSKMSINDLEARWKDVPEKYYIIIAHFLTGHINDSEAIDRFNGPILKASIKSVYWIFLIQYAVLAMLGIVMNVAIIAYIIYHRLYKDVTHAFIINLAFCHFVQCALVLPITLMVMLIQNWIFGQFLCFFLPMLQDIPLHVAMITHILIAWDRMRWLSNPMKVRLPAFVCCCATWLTGMVIALPYPIYTIYVEIGNYVPLLNGMGLCVINLMDDMHEYVRGLFLIMYCAPTVLLAYLYIRTSQELRPPDGPFAVMMYEHRADMRNRQRNSSATSLDHRSMGGNRLPGSNTTTTATTTGFGSGLTTITTHTNGGGGGGGASTGGHHLPGGVSALSHRSYDLYSAELDVYREKRNQRNFGSMAAAQVVCLCPLMVLRFARLSMVETYENQKHFDFTYLMFVWIAFLPTVIFPCIYASQILPRNEQERLRGYFRLSSRRFKKSRSDAGGKSGSGGGNGPNSHSSSSREDSIEKDENTNTTQATSIIPGSEGYISGICSCNGSVSMSTATGGGGGGRNEAKAGGVGKYKHHANCSGGQQQSKQRPSNDKVGITPVAAGSGGKSLGKDVRVKKKDVKTNILAEAAGRRISGPGGRSSQRKLTLDSLDNHSCSNITSSTYCNGTGGSQLDGTSNFGDGEDSSIVSGMIVQNNGNTVAYYDKKWAGLNPGASMLRQKDISFSDCSTFSTRRDSSSTLERDLEIIDLLERERSMDHLQEIIEREQHGESVRLAGSERRRLPDIEKIYQRSPQAKLDPYNYDLPATASASTISAKDSHTTSTSVMSLRSDPLHSGSSGNEAYSAASTLNKDELALARKVQESQMALPPRGADDEDGEDEDAPPQDFFDQYTPGGENIMPSVTSANPNAITGSGSGYQYQYSRRLSRKTSHHSQGSMGSHRGTKRDSFNSLNGSDLIAGAFGELDPTQPLTKMSVIENRMRRSSGRNSSFSASSARSSLKSRDYSHGSSHSAHPELDFRENIFAEL